VNVDPWDRADGTTEPSSAPPRRNANHAGARPWPAVPSEGRGERATARPAAQPPNPRGEAGLGSRFLRAHLAWILLITLAVTAGAYVVAKTQTAIYTSQATVVVFGESASANSQQPVIMATEKGIVSSEAVMSIASRSVHLSQRALQSGLSVSVPVDTNLLDIAFSDPNPRVAQRAAEGIAYAYIVFRTPKTPTVAPGTKTPTPVPTVPGAVQPSLITDAGLPTSPTSPNRWLDVGVALILGLALGTGVALVRDAIDDRLRGPLDLATQANAPVLVLIPAFRTQKGSAGGRLVVVHSPGSRVAEAYRDLRTRVLHAASGRDVDALLVTSSIREDKATVAANLAAALALSGRRVILVCADLRWGRTHELFGLSNGVGLTSVLSERASLASALRDTHVGGLQLLSAGPAIPDPAAMLQSPALHRLLGKLRGRADFVVIDAPPMLASADTAALADLSDMILLVADARLSRRAQVRAATHQLGRAREDLIFCVFDNVGQGRPLPRPSGTPALASRQPTVKAKVPDPLTPAQAFRLNGDTPPAAEIPSAPSKPLNGESIVGGGAAGRARRNERPPSWRP